MHSLICLNCGAPIGRLDAVVFVDNFSPEAGAVHHGCIAAFHAKRKVKVGVRVRVNAAFTTLKEGTVELVDSFGFRVSGLWFGWHELEGIVDA